MIVDKIVKIIQEAWGDEVLIYTRLGKVKITT